jgi:hypothetical protein
MKSTTTKSKLRLQKQKTEITKLMELLKIGMDVSLRKMKQALKAEDYLMYDKYRPRTAKQTLSGPAFRYLSAYSKQLLKADGLYNYAEQVGMLSSLQKFKYQNWTPHAKAEAAYEKAYEMLEDMLSMYSDIYNFLDRPVSLINDVHDTNPYEAPRQIGTDSKYSLRNYTQMKMELGQYQLMYLKSSLEQIDQQLGISNKPTENSSVPSSDVDSVDLDLIDEKDLSLLKSESNDEYDNDFNWDIDDFDGDLKDNY